MFIVTLDISSETEEMDISIEEACSLVNAMFASLAQTENVGLGLSRFGAWGDLQAEVRPLSESLSC